MKRKYESIRRQWKEQDVDGHDEIQRVKIRAKKYRQRKRRVSAYFTLCIYLTSVFRTYIAVVKCMLVIEVFYT